MTTIMPLDLSDTNYLMKLRTHLFRRQLFLGFCAACFVDGCIDGLLSGPEDPRRRPVLRPDAAVPLAAGQLRLVI